MYLEGTIFGKIVLISEMVLIILLEFDSKGKGGKHTYQEPDSKLAQKPLIMLVIIFVIKICVVQRMMRGRQAQLPPAIELVLSLLSMEFSLFQQAKR